MNTTVAAQPALVPNMTFSDSEWNNTGTTTVNNTTVTKFTMTSPEIVDLLATAKTQETTETNITPHNATLYVASDDTIRKLSFSVTLDMGEQTYHVTATKTWTQIGNTTVTPPEWTPNALD